MVAPATDALTAQEVNVAEFVGQIPARPRSEWHEDHGPALWWRFPIQEPPYVGTPLDDAWQEHELEGFYTHWTPIPIPPKPWPTSETVGADPCP